jgi:hypothetical protein
VVGAATGEHLGNSEQPLQIPPTRGPRRRKTWPRSWRITAGIVFVAVAIVGTSAVVNREVGRRLATLPLVTTSSSQPSTTVAAPRPTTPKKARVAPRVVAVAETTTSTTQVIAQEVPQSAYDIINKLDALPVRDEYQLGYSRYRFGLWRDDDNNGCTSRDEVLVRDAVESVSRTKPCDIVAGEWRSLYEDAVVNDPDAMTVDHVVGLWETWKSGGWDWTDAQRNDYLNDLETRNVMLAVSKAALKDKAGADPKDWLPPNVAFRCQYLQTWVDVKTAWKLAVDAGERESIAAAALNC